MSSVVLALLTGLSVLAWTPPRARFPSAFPAPRPESGAAASGFAWMRAVVSVGAGLAPLLVVSGAVGPLLVPVAAAASWHLLSAAETPNARRQREAMARELPHAVDLLSSVLRSGGAPVAAVDIVARACVGPLSGRLAQLHRQLLLSDEPVRVWQALGRDETDAPLAPLGEAMARAETGGASVADSVERLASELEHAALAEVEDRARTVGVRAAVPLGVCLLPSFVLLGIVPTVAGLLRSIAP